MNARQVGRNRRESIDALHDTPGRTPGKATLTSQLAAEPASSGAPVQRKAATVTSEAPSAPARGDWLAAFRRPASAGPVQRKSGTEATAPVAAPSGGGQAMPQDVRAKMERAFNADFSAVRVHQGGDAAALGARAYTRGTDLHFAPGAYDPSSTAGQELIGHELAHVVQQAQGRVAASTMQKKGVAINADSGLEHEADVLGARAARGESVHNESGTRRGVAAASGALVQRNKTVEEEQVPVQTDGNCGLFSILTAMRAFGFDGGAQAKAIAELDKMTKQSDETFLGEIFTVDLMLDIINGLQVDGKQILTAEAVGFDSPERLKELLAVLKKNDDVAVLIGYSKPDEYDRYYKLRGEHVQNGTTDNPVLEEALDDKVGVEDFKVKDAHWA